MKPPKVVPGTAWPARTWQGLDWPGMAGLAVAALGSDGQGKGQFLFTQDTTTMHKAIDFAIRGLSPLMMHNGQLADPLNPFAKRMKELSGKRNKTDSDYQAMYDVEWEGSLYLNDKGQPVITGEMIEAAMIEGGKKQKLGQQCKAGILCDGDWPILFDGPKSLDKLKADRKFRDIRKVKIQRNSVMRCRPIFVPWSLNFTLHYLPDLLNESQVVAIVETVGRIVGIGDFRPKYGRFVLDS